MLEGTAGQANELKMQGVIEAAQDPKSNVDADDAQRAIVSQARAAGATAIQFDPNASPEQKAAIAKESAGPAIHRKHQVAALASDADDGPDAGYDLPPPTTAGAIEQHSSPTTSTANGQPVAENDPFSKVGWAPRFGNPGDKEEQGIQDHQTFLEGKLDDKFFGDWYHNAAIIIFACLMSWTIAVLGGGLGWIFILMTACGTYYRTSIRRVRHRFRDDITRQLAMNRLETDVESLEWINSFMSKFWPIYAPILCSSIIASVDQVLSTSTPAFLDSMRMKTFTLGTKPPRLEHVKTYPRQEDDIVMMDWKFSFTPNDIADLTHAAIKNKINPKLVLEIRIGKAMISKGLDVIVEDMACSGIMRVKMKLQLEFPFVQRVEICFLERPTIDYVCKPLGGDTLGFDINFIPGLEGFILEQIHANLGPMMYAPNVFPIELAKMLAGSPVDQAIGVLQIQFHGAHGLKNPDKFSGTPDPYATVSINNRDILGKTKTVQGNANPRWNETVNVILTSLREPLTIAVFDWNEYRKDKDLGVATFNLEKLEKESEFDNQTLEITANGRPRGNVSCDIRFFPVLEGRKLEGGIVEEPPESNTGIAKFTVEQAKDLDGTKSMIGALNPYAILLLNGKEVQISQKLKRTNNPIWNNASKELLISDRKKARLGLVIKDDRDLAADPILASYQIKLDDLLDLTKKGQEWYTLAGAKTGRAKMKLEWKPVALKGSAGGGGGYVDPIGVMRFHFRSAKDLKNLENVGKSDPYARVMLSGIQKGRTVTFKNNLNPDWDEVFYVPVHTTREKLVVEVMDEENLGKDRTLGQIEVDAAEYIRQTETGEYAVHDSKNDVISSQLRIGTGTPKGVLNFTVAFYPTLNVEDPEDEDKADKEHVGLQTSGDIDRKSVDSGTNASNSQTRPTRSDTVGTISSLRPASINSTGEEAQMRKALNEGEKEQTEADEVAVKEVPKVKIGVDDLNQYDSGLVVFTIHEGDLAHPGTYLQVLMDDMKYPAWQSAKTKQRKHAFNETGDAMVRELDLSRITLRIVSDANAKDDKDDDIKARLSGSTLETLKRCLYTPTDIKLKDEHGHASNVKVSMRYLPVKMQLDPSESFNNQGNLRVEVLDATDLPAADRNGYSDPFCRFVLDGKEVYKTNKQKKTLHPAWNEFFEVPVRSRTGGNFTVNVYDWDFGDKADFLGAAAIPLDVLEPFQAQEVVLNLDGKSGSVRLKMLFKPDYITRARQGSSTFSGTFAAPGKIIGAPVKGVGKVGTAVGGGLFKGASFVGRGFKRRTNDGGEQALEDANAEMRPTSMESSQDAANRPETSNGYANGTPSIDGIAGKDSLQAPSTPHQRNVSMGAQSLSPGAETGTAIISVISASGFAEDTKLEVHILQGSKEILKTKSIKSKTGDAAWEDEGKTIQCNAASPFKVVVKNDKVFKDEELGENTFYLNDQAGGGERQVQCGSGVVVLRTSFQPADTGSIAPSVSPAGKSKGIGRLMSRKDRSVAQSD